MILPVYLPASSSSAASAAPPHWLPSGTHPRSSQSSSPGSPAPLGTQSRPSEPDTPSSAGILSQTFLFPTTSSPFSPERSRSQIKLEGKQANRDFDIEAPSCLPECQANFSFRRRALFSRKPDGNMRKLILFKALNMGDMRRNHALSYD